MEVEYRGLIITTRHPNLFCAVSGKEFAKWPAKQGDKYLTFHNGKSMIVPDQTRSGGRGNDKYNAGVFEFVTAPMFIGSGPQNTHLKTQLKAFGASMKVIGKMSGLYASAVNTIAEGHLGTLNPRCS